MYNPPPVGQQQQQRFNQQQPYPSAFGNNQPQQQQQQQQQQFQQSYQQPQYQNYQRPPAPPSQSSLASARSPPPLQAPVPQYSSHKILGQPQQNAGRGPSPYQPQQNPGAPAGGFGFGYSGGNAVSGFGPNQPFSMPPQATTAPSASMSSAVSPTPFSGSAGSFGMNMGAGPSGSSFGAASSSSFGQPSAQQPQTQGGFMGMSASTRPSAQPANYVPAGAQQPAAGMYAQAPQQPAGLFGSNFLGDFQGNAATQIGMQLGSQAFAQVQQNMNQNIDRYIKVGELRYYFNVSTAYVMNKLKLMVFPYMHASWARLMQRQSGDYGNVGDASAQQAESYAPPREDLNAPDLYIPLMSYVTYVLVDGLVAGVRTAILPSAGSKIAAGSANFSTAAAHAANHISGSSAAAAATAAMSKFTPDRLGTTATFALTLICLEVFLFKFGFYIINIVNNVGIYDLVSYCGYKFVTAIFLVALKLVLDKWSWMFLAIAAYMLVSYGFFTLRTLRYIILPDQAINNTVDRHGRYRRIIILISIAVAQCFFILILL